MPEVNNIIMLEEGAEPIVLLLIYSELQMLIL